MRSATISTLCPALVLALTACSPSPAHAGGGLEVGTPGTLLVEDVRRMVGEASLHQVFVPEAPLGLPEDLSAFVPADNPLTRAKVELGLELFFDPRLSRGGALACASCHHPSRAWTDGAALPTGAEGRSGARSAPTIANRLLGTTQAWDGRARTLEEQGLLSLSDPLGMACAPEEAAARLNAIEGYRLQFEAVFGGPATPERLAKALAAFQRTLLAGESRFDVLERARPFLEHEPGDDANAELLARRKTALQAEEGARLSAEARRGLELFAGKARCTVCHAGPDFSDGLFHNLGIGMEAPAPDLGRFTVTQAERDRGAFRTPTLRNVARTAPYMHDGSLATLGDVVEHHDRGGMPNPWLSEELRPLGLTHEEKRDLVAFLEEGLTGTTTLVAIPRLP
jgi:cytochrome c peroxidase